MPGPLPNLDAAAQVYRVARKLALYEEPQRVVGAVPRVVLEVVAADAAAVIRLGENGIETLAAFGPQLDLGSAWMQSALEDALSRGRPTSAHDDPQRVAMRPNKARLLAVPLRLGRAKAAIVVARTVPGRELKNDDLSPLGVVAVVVSEAWSRASARSQLSRWQGRAHATVQAVPEGFLFFDEKGRIQDVDESACGLLGVDGAACIGRQASDIPTLEPLATGLEARRTRSQVAPVEVDGVRVLVKDAEWDGGRLWMLTADEATEGQAGSAFRARYTFEDVITEDPVVEVVLRDARQAALSAVPVLITGESGTGKELLAQAIHSSSPRGGAPFVAVNVAAIPGELLESELFGYAPGAFTGARQTGKPGSFELARNGTLLLDEIGEMPAAMQAKLLRVLQENQVVRVGGTRPVTVHARIVATTNRNLQKEVEGGRFRLDLYHRLRVVHLDLPPLRHRMMDIRVLTRHFLDSACKQMGRKPLRITDEVMNQLLQHRWPGNLRELSNVLLGVVSLLPLEVTTIDEMPIFPRRPELTPIAAPPRMMGPPARLPRREKPKPRLLSEVEKEAVKVALEHFEGNMSHAAKALGISRTTLYKKVERYNLTDQ